MTISNRLNRTTLLGNGISTLIPIEFPFHSVDDLVVIETILATGAQTIKALTTHYTVTGAQDALGHYPTGGSVVMVTAPAVTVSITVYRDVSALQQVILVENEKIPVKASIESPLDRLTMIAQRLIDRVDRTMTQPDGDSANIGNLPAKVVRASRYLGFDGDGNPTMMQTPTGMVTSIAQLTESTYAGLPAPGAAGSLRKVTDSVRGIWMDTGVQWAQIGWGAANILDFGAVGDGSDDTAAIQAALDTGADVVIPFGSFTLAGSAPLLLRHHRQRLFGLGEGSILRCTATAGLFCAIGLVENIVGVSLRDFTLLGNASSEPAGPAPVRGIVTGVNSTGTAHSAVSWNARFTAENLFISGITPGTTGFNLGIQVNKSNKSRIAHCNIESVYGTNESFGYGIVVHGEDIKVHEVNVYSTIAGQGRHAFYLTSTPARVTVSNCHAEGFQGEPFTTNIGSGGEGLAFVNCTAKDCMQSSTGTHDAVFAFHGGSKGRIINCRAYGTSASDNFGVTVKDHDHAIVESVYMENVDLHAVYIENADYTRVTNLDINVAGVIDPTQYGGVTVIQSDYVAVDSVTMVGPGRFVARLDSSSPQPVGCRFSNLLPSGSFTYLVENEELNPDTNRVASLFIPVVPRASLPSAASAADNLVAIDDNGSGDRNLMVYAKGQRFRIDGGSNI